MIKQREFGDLDEIKIYKMGIKKTNGTEKEDEKEEEAWFLVP